MSLAALRKSREGREDCKKAQALQPVPSPNADNPSSAQPGTPRRKITPICAAGPSQTEPTLTQKGPRPAGRDPWARMPIWKGLSYFTACLRAERTAASMALLVTVAPATPSMSAPWAASTCWA